MRLHGKTRYILASILVLILYSGPFLDMKTSGQIFQLSDLYVYVRVDMDEDAIAVYNVNLSMGPKTIRALEEANWTLKIQLPKWAASNLVSSAEMPKLILEDKHEVDLKLEEETDYDYLVAEIPPVQTDRLNATVKFGLVQRDEIYDDRVGFKLPVLTGFNIMPEYVNFTFLTTGTIREYSLRYFNPILSNNTVIGLWNQYFRTRTVGNITGKISFSKPFDRCIIKSLFREITVTQRFRVFVKDHLKLKYVGNTYRGEILKLIIPSNIGQVLRAKDALGPLQTSSVASESNTSIITVNSRYLLKSGQEYEVSIEYSIPVKDVLVNTSGSLIAVSLKGLANYNDIINNYHLSVKVEGERSWRVNLGSITTDIEAGKVFLYSMTNAMPGVLVQPLEISFIFVQLESGRSISVISGLLTVFVLLVIDLFKEKAVKPPRELKMKEIETLIDDFIQALKEKIDYEARLEDSKVKNALGKLSSKDYRVNVEEYDRRISRAEDRISRILEQLVKSMKAGEEIKRRYAVFEEMDNDSKKIIDNAIDRFRRGMIARNVFENLSERYMKENKRRREMAANEVYSALERLVS